MRDLRTWFIWGGLCVFIALPVLYGSVKAYQWYSVDTLLRSVLEDVSRVQTYTQKVQTQIILDDRILGVEGTYHIDKALNMFASYATTSLYIPGERIPHVFSLENIAINRDVYLRIKTESDLLRISIPHTENWIYFPSTAIPDRFVNIATPGPILDNLLLLSEFGAYVTFVSKSEDATFATPLTLFTLRLSGKKALNGSPLVSLLDRIGDGIIRVWVDPHTKSLRYMHFANASYQSTTTVSSLHTPTIISAPIATTSSATL